jgi:uncharacterized phiE125 gp8 family phage protein
MLTVVYPPESLPISVADAKLYARIPYSVEDVLVTNWIKAGRDIAETYQRRTYIETTYKLSLDGYPCFPLTLPRSTPHRQVDRIKIYDTDSSANILYDNTTDVDQGYFDIDTVSSPGRINVKYGVVLPTTTLRETNGFEVQYVAGYDSSTSVPAYICDALYLYCAYRNDNRVGETPLPSQFYDLLDKGRIYA